jgi:hypothetical protein
VVKEGYQAVGTAGGQRSQAKDGATRSDGHWGRTCEFPAVLGGGCTGGTHDFLGLKGARWKGTWGLLTPQQQEVAGRVRTLERNI